MAGPIRRFLAKRESVQETRKRRHVTPISKGGNVRRIGGTRFSIEKGPDGKLIHEDVEVGGFFAGTLSKRIKKY